jgi:hypothetical protein
MFGNNLSWVGTVGAKLPQESSTETEDILVWAEHVLMLTFDESACPNA